MFIPFESKLPWKYKILFFQFAFDLTKAMEKDKGSQCGCGKES